MDQCVQCGNAICPQGIPCVNGVCQVPLQSSAKDASDSASACVGSGLPMTFLAVAGGVLL